MSNGLIRTLVAAGSLAALASCVPNSLLTQRPDAPAPYWFGYLTELDGVATKNSGIRLEIGRVRSPNDPGLLYTLETGCVGAGFVVRSGEVRAAETLRPCDAEDVPRMLRLNRISHDGTGPLPGQRSATLRWAGSDAALESDIGTARFTSPDYGGSAR